MMKHPVPETLLAGIGDITVSFQLLEMMLGQVVCSQISWDQRIGRIVTAGVPFKGLRALAISLYLHQHGEDSDLLILRNLVKRAATIEKARNAITHSVWGASEHAHAVTRMKSIAQEKNGYKHESERIDIEKLKEISSEINKLSGEILDFYVKLERTGKVVKKF